MRLIAEKSPKARHDAEAKEIVSQIEAMGCRGLAIKADVQRYDDAERMVETVVEELGGLDIMVCNAGINWDGVIWKMTEEQWDTVFKDQKSGKIVNISSINGMRGKFAQTNYAASKGGEIALTKSLARELGKFNVNVNAVAPGMVMTEMAENIPPEFLTKAMDETALGRFASPEECADLVAFLCSDRARHITGEVIKIDGGQYM